MSTFQTLPYLVIEKIFSYIIVLNNTKKDFFRASSSPFLHLCQSWRSVALQHTLSDYKITVSHHKIEKEIRAWPADLNLPVASAGPWVKTLYVTVDFPLLNPLTKRSIKGKMLFESSHSLEVCIDRKPCEKQIPEGVQVNITRSSQFLQDIAPNVRDVKVIDSGFNDCMNDKVCWDHYASLVCLLFSRIAKRKLAMVSDHDLGLGDLKLPHTVNEITHFDLLKNRWMGSVDLVRRFSATLQVFKASEYYTEKSLYGLLVNNTTKEYMAYPRMRYLSVVIRLRKEYGKQAHTYPGAVPFPNLKNMELGDIYPYEDDVLFRGSQHSLRFAKFCLTSNLATLLTDNNTFSGDIPYKKLENVEVSTKYFGRDDNYLQLVADIGRYAKVLRFKNGYQGSKPTVEAINLHFGSLYNLQVLHIDSSEFALVDILELVKQLPRLTDLQCLTTPMNDLPHFHSQKRYFEQLVSTYYPLSQCLRAFCLKHTDGMYKDLKVKSIILLAVLCPNI